MKNSYIIRLEPYEIRDFTLVIKNKWDCIKLLLNCTRFINFNLISRAITLSPKSCKKMVGEYLKLDIIPIPRVYLYVGGNKYISIVFPFKIDVITDNIKFWYAGVCLTEHIISGIFTLINLHNNSYSSIGKTNNSLIELYLSNEEFEPIPENSYYILGELLSLEMGYIRHDHDPVKAKGKIHPEFHFDINYSQDATFKYGLPKMLSTQEFENIFDKNSDCYFLQV